MGRQLSIPNSYSGESPNWKLRVLILVRRSRTPGEVMSLSLGLYHLIP